MNAVEKSNEQVIDSAGSDATKRPAFALRRALKIRGRMTRFSWQLSGRSHLPRLHWSPFPLLLVTTTLCVYGLVSIIKRAGRQLANDVSGISLWLAGRAYQQHPRLVSKGRPFSADYWPW